MPLHVLGRQERNPTHLEKRLDHFGPEEATVPLPERRPEPAASPSPAPDPLPSRISDPPAPRPSEAPVRLPYPDDLMNPAEVPEEVWQRARAAKRHG
jgi:hypothetical protein